MRRTLWFLAAILGLVVLGGGLYLHWRGQGLRTESSRRVAQAPSQGAVERIPVKTVQAQKRDLEVTLPVFGAINYLEKVDVAVEMPGILKEVLVKPGDLVLKGQVVAVLDTELLQAELRTKSALRAQAQAQLQLAAWQYQAQKKIHRVGGVSYSDLQEAEARYHEKQAEVARYDAEMAQTRTQIKKASAISPIVGIVGQKNYNCGERVPTQSDKGVVTLMQIDEVYAEAEVNERDMARLRPGLEVTVYPDAYPQNSFRGPIERLEPVLRQESRSVIAKVRLLNQQLRLKPGMFARMEVVLDKVPQVVAIPVAALRQAPDKSWQVFVISDNIAFLRKVVIGLTTPQWVEVKEGLKPGEVVVVEGGERLRDLARVIATPTSQPSP
jgi:RND family efflux transporter MFP subunit